MRLQHTFYTDRRNINSYDASTHRQTYTFLNLRCILWHDRGRPSSSCKINTKFIYIKLKNDIGPLKLYKNYNIKVCTLSNIYKCCLRRYVRGLYIQGGGVGITSLVASGSHIIVVCHEAVHLFETVRETLLLRELVLLERHH